MVNAASAHRVHDPETVTFFDDPDVLLKVATTSPPQAVAWALVRSLREGKAPVMRAIGHGAIGQAVKAQILARGLAAPMGLDLVFLPAFDGVMSHDGTEINSVIWRVFCR